MDVSKAPRVLGFDAIGVVESVGNEVTMFNQT
jgi:NADPH:quinone reductase-like Zn-dependent oxidoreductase